MMPALRAASGRSGMLPLHLEAYGGYHFDVLDGVNVQAGIFMSYIGLFSYYNFDNWAYQPSYVSSNTPWFFSGVHAQIFPNEHLKIEPWIINGWQSYGQFNNGLGFGGQILWRSNGKFSFVGNQYFFGQDTLGLPGRRRYHTDDSIQYMHYHNPNRVLDRMAFSLTPEMPDARLATVSVASETGRVDQSKASSVTCFITASGLPTTTTASR